MVYVIMRQTQGLSLGTTMRTTHSFWFWILFFAAQLSFLTTLCLPYQGEEGVYTISSMEMAFHQEWIAPTQYGSNYARPPLFNWLMIPLAKTLGWEQVLVAARLIAAASTLLTSLVLMYLMRKLFSDRKLALFSALIYMNGDLLFRRGWLAYADPLFSLFIFSAIAFLWIALKERKSLFLIPAILSVMASFLTKAITGYAFYGVAVVVFYCRADHSNRKFFYKPGTIILHLIALAFPFVWSAWISGGAHGTSMVHDVLTKFSLDQLLDYGLKILRYPLDTFVRFLPSSALLLWFFFRDRKNTFKNCFRNPILITALWILFLNYIPYWVAPQSYVRYLLPLYPLVALVLSFMLWEMAKTKNYIIKTTVVFLSLGIIVRYALGIWGLPYYEHKYRGDYQAVARDIMQITGEHPLYPVYIEDDSAVGLSVTAYLDVYRMPNAPLIRPQANFIQGFLVARSPEVSNTSLWKTYHLGSHRLYLLCRGCETKTALEKP